MCTFLDILQYLPSLDLRHLLGIYFLTSSLNNNFAKLCLNEVQL